LRLFGGQFRKYLVTIVSAQAVIWLVVLIFTSVLAHFLTPSPQISFAFAGDSGYAGIQLFDLDHRLPALIANTSSPVRAGEVQPPYYSWSPDGRQLVYEDRTTGLPRIMRTTVPGIPELLSTDDRNCMYPSWSARDEIAYSCGGTLYLLSGQDAPEMHQKVALGQGSMFFNLMWSPDGSRLAHLELGSGRSIILRDAEGNELVRHRFETDDARIGRLFDWSSENRLIYITTESWLPYLLDVLEVEAGETAVFSTPQPLEWVSSTINPSDRVIGFQWSPDQTQAAYILYDSPVSLVVTDSQLEIVKQDIRFYYPPMNEMTWASDSQSLYINRLWDETRSDITRVDVATGIQTQITPIFDVRIVHLAWRPGT
jgi:hypothetical protein